MREENKLNKAIKQNGVDTQSDVLDELKRRYPQYVEQSDKKKAPVKKRKWALISAIAAAAVCIAIVVPCALLLPNSNNGSAGTGKDNYRYCTPEEYEKIEVQYTIGEYRENNDRNFLYFDWYEVCEECSTSCYTANSDNEVLCLEEQAYLPQSDEVVQLSVTKANVHLDVLDLIITKCKNKDYVGNHTVKWDTNDTVAMCTFEYNEYRYFVQIFQGQDENRLFELVAELLETK